MMMRMQRGALLGAWVVVAAACANPTDSNVRVQDSMGMVEWYESHAALEANADPLWPDPGTALIEAPDEVDAGVPFDIVVRTLGLSGCWSALRTEVVLQSARATILPIDRDRSDPDTACTLVLQALRHDARLVFDDPGPARIVVRGRRVLGDGFDEFEEIEIEKSILVR